MNPVDSIVLIEMQINFGMEQICCSVKVEVTPIVLSRGGFAICVCMLVERQVLVRRSSDDYVTVLKQPS